MNRPITELAELLRSMNPVLHEGTYVFAQVPHGTDLAPMSPVASVNELEGLTVVVAEAQAQRANLDAGFRAAWITLEVHSDLEAVGLTAAFAAALARERIACNVIAGAHHDHLFVPWARAGDAMAALRALQQGHRRAPPRLVIANKNYSSWSLRPWMLMHELRITFDEVLVPFGGDAASPAIGDYSPSGKVPCLIDGGTVVWDSLAIAEYLAEQHPSVWPANATARAWARSVAAEMHSGFGTLRNTCTMNCGLRVRLLAMSPELRLDIARIDTLWQEGLSRFNGPFLAGSALTAVDAFFAPVAFRVQTYALPMSAASLDYAQRLRALPSMQTWYTAALVEPWRDAAHENEARQAGEWLADLRVGAEPR